MWGVPVDHEYFKQATIPQWLWYFYNFIKDQDEEFTTQRSLLEYHAAFSEPEMVSRVRKTRESSEKAKTDKDFAKTVKSLFGRDLNLPGIKSTESKMELTEVGNLLDKISVYDGEQKAMKTKTKFNFQHWADINLE